MQAAADRGDYAAALAFQDRLTPLHAGVFVEAGVTGAKYGLTVLGKVREEVRLPLVPMAEASKAVVRKAMVHAGLINA